MAIQDSTGPGRGGRRSGSGRKPQPHRYVCKRCFVEFVVIGARKRPTYCSAACKVNPPTRFDKHCVRCGAAFVVFGSSKARQKHCSESCLRECQAECGGWNRNAKIACKQCGCQFHPKKGRRIYCSRPCADGFRNARKQARIAAPRIPKPVPENVCGNCGAVFSGYGKWCSKGCHVANERRKYAAAVESKRHKVCAVCGVSFMAPLSKGRLHKFCSDACRASCKKAAASRTRAHTGRKYKHRAKPGAIIEKGVTRLRVFMRDGWRCKLCGIGTPRRLSGTHEPNAPELDHIVPLAKGGDHAWHNVQCSCRRCNIAKGDNVVGQLRLAM